MVSCVTSLVLMEHLQKRLTPAALTCHHESLQSQGRDGQAMVTDTQWAPCAFHPCCWARVAPELLAKIQGGREEDSGCLFCANQDLSSVIKPSLITDVN